MSTLFRAFVDEDTSCIQDSSIKAIIRRVLRQFLVSVFVTTSLSLRSRSHRLLLRHSFHSSLLSIHTLQFSILHTLLPKTMSSAMFNITELDEMVYRQQEVERGRHALHPANDPQRHQVRKMVLVLQPCPQGLSPGTETTQGTIASGEKSAPFDSSQQL